MFYRKHYEFIGGLRVYFDPSAKNMPPVQVVAPGEACEFLGLEALRVLFCNAELSRADLAFDGADFTPGDMAGWVRAGNLRCKSSSRHFIEDLGDKPDGETLRIGSRTSERCLRAYDGRGFTRVELELKGAYARSFLSVLLAEDGEFVASSVGLLRDFVDFVDASSSSNISRATLLPSWEAFTAGLEKVRLRVAAATVPTVERVEKYIEQQAAASLVVYLALGNDFSRLLAWGKNRLKPHHRSMLTFAGVSV
jgi:DNA relaxase NicK